MLRLVIESAIIGALIGVLGGWLPTLFGWNLDPIIPSITAGIGAGIYAARRYPALR